MLTGQGLRSHARCRFSCVDLGRRACVRALRGGVAQREVAEVNAHALGETTIDRDLKPHGPRLLCEEPDYVKPGFSRPQACAKPDTSRRP